MKFDIKNLKKFALAKKNADKEFEKKISEINLNKDYKKIQSLIADANNLRSIEQAETLISQCRQILSLPVDVENACNLIQKALDKKIKIYSAAQDFYRKKCFKQALVLFEELGDFEDAFLLVSICGYQIYIIKRQYLTMSLSKEKFTELWLQDFLKLNSVSGNTFKPKVLYNLAQKMEAIHPTLSLLIYKNIYHYNDSKDKISVLTQQIRDAHKRQNIKTFLIVIICCFLYAIFILLWLIGEFIL